MLILQIKKKWFDMILSGEKKEEYREIKSYYTTRFRNVWGYPAYWHETHKVTFRNGYSHNSPSFVAEVSLGKRTGKPEWELNLVRTTMFCTYIMFTESEEWE